MKEIYQPLKKLTVGISGGRRFRRQSITEPFMQGLTGSESFLTVYCLQLGGGWVGGGMLLLCMFGYYYYIKGKPQLNRL